MKKQNTLKRISSLPASDDIFRVVLPNGIVVLARENAASPSVLLSGYLPAGQLYEPVGKLGLASFTADALMRGAGKRSHMEIYDSLESVGGSLGFDAGNFTVGFSGKVLAEDLDLLLELASDALRKPAFPPAEVERLRAQILTGLALRAQSTEAMASLAFDELLYGDHPYGQPVEGHPETVRKLTRHDLAEFHQSTYGPRGLTICLVGGVNPQKAVEKVAAALGDWQNPNQPAQAILPPVSPLVGIRRRDIPMADKSQVDLFVGVVGPARAHPLYLPAVMANHVFGQFGMYGRIGKVVREDAGLAYYAYSGLSGGIGPGPWYVCAGVDPENTERAIALIQAEIARLVEHGITAEELLDSQENFVGSLPLSLESNAGVAAVMLNIERYQLGLDYYLDYETRIRAITAGQALEAAQAFWNPENLVITTAGPSLAGRRG